MFSIQLDGTTMALPTERLVEKVRKVKGGPLGRERVCGPLQRGNSGMQISNFGRSSRGSHFLSTGRGNTKRSLTGAGAISQASFLNLFTKGLLERRLEPSLWDPVDRTAIAQAGWMSLNERAY